MATFNIVHTTKYQYNWPIKESINEIRLFPHDFENQEVIQFELLITNNPHVDISKDYYGNRVGNFNSLEPHKELTIEARSIVRVNHSRKIPEIDTIKVQDLANDIENSIYLQRLTTPETIDNQKEINLILKKLKLAEKPITAIAQECNKYIYKNYTYTKGITNIETTIDEILEIKKGVCQDFTNLLLQLLRTVGIPSRYVSGYICPNESGFRGEGATHAWVEIYSPTQGWLGLDPTNNIWTMDSHVKLSVGKNFHDCTPVKGTFKGLARQTLSVCVSIGYEDGRHFEEVNDVQLPEISIEQQVQLDYIEQLQIKQRLHQQQQ
ncbi:transglutaminase family protein [Flavobacterium cellulosilyticum]|uniref:Transglutaminase family protein n=1 Tax=Flavobacterium cellulosilyticum TaxID=2541731 RepID=A0A4R5CPJ6_9FLAO|nr:transglutaminase family protein [Flavobacterium cellulosilyticum]TDD99544.1 transglutaminase family protein [Flavobacterium cellulosilyticum]